MISLSAAVEIIILKWWNLMKTVRKTGEIDSLTPSEGALSLSVKEEYLRKSVLADSDHLPEPACFSTRVLADG